MFEEEKLEFPRKVVNYHQNLSLSLNMSSTNKNEARTVFLVLITLFLVGSINSADDAQTCDDDSKCKTGSCNTTTGHCICDLPHPSTILDGDRPFQGGRMCDETVMMCDGTNSFWCEHDGKCEEIVQGESYKCKCQTGYSGQHCQYTGTPCGGGGDGGFCFHGATCLAQTDHSVTCECPSGWKGVDCSLPTTTTQTDVLDPDGAGLDREDRSRASWVVVVVAVSVSLAAVAGGIIIYFKKFFDKDDKAAPRFQQLTKMQSHRILDDDDDEDEDDDDQKQVHHRHSHN